MRKCETRKRNQYSKIKKNST